MAQTKTKKVEKKKRRGNVGLRPVCGETGVFGFVEFDQLWEMAQVRLILSRLRQIQLSLIRLSSTDLLRHDLALSKIEPNLNLSQRPNPTIPRWFVLFLKQINKILNIETRPVPNKPDPQLFLPPPATQCNCKPRCSKLTTRRLLIQKIWMATAWFESYGEAFQRWCLVSCRRRASEALI